MQVRLINSRKNTPSMNMAIDEALLTSKLPVLRFYQWNPPGLSLGYFQHMQSINTDFCSQNDIDIVRRLTGGNAVLHDNELTYSFIIDESLMPQSIQESYKEISKGILRALELLGLAPSMNTEVSEEEKSAICFNDPSWYEILVNDKKIVGSAQKRAKGKVLQHGAILIDLDIDHYAQCFTQYSADIIETLKKRITSIAKEGKNVSYDELAAAMRKGFSEALDIEFVESSLTEEEQELAEKLHKEKYSTKEWNFKK